MKIKAFGWRSQYLDQISRIEAGFITLGHELSDNNPDIVYKNEDFFDEAIDFINKCDKRPFVIFNILDLQTHNLNYSLDKLKEQLKLADRVTCISNTVKGDIKKYLDIDAIVIYNPSKSTFSLGSTTKPFPFLYVGRANSPNKRFNLIKDTLRLANWPSNYLKVCGSEFPAFGDYLGIVDDESLNNLYNQAGIVLLPSITEGIGLSFIEALQASTPAIGCSDCKAAMEFLPECMICEPDPNSIRNKILDIKNNYSYYKQVAFDYGLKYKEQFSSISVAQRIIDIYNNK